MFWSRRLNTPRLIELSRSLRYSIASGIMLRDAVALLAARGTRPLRPVADRLARDLAAGWSLRDAVGKQEEAFPPLFVKLVEVGEETGNLGEVMEELERYYEMQARLQREFLGGIAWPAFQFAAAIFVVAGLIFILGELPTVTSDRPPLDPLGFGLVGAPGAITFLAIVFGVLAALTAVFFALRRLLRRRAVVERIVFRVPLLGPCSKAICLARFSVALQMVLDSGASVLRTFRLAFTATDNAAFAAAVPGAEAALRRGESVTDCLTGAGLFPQEFLSAVAVGEDAGRLPEVLRQQAHYYDDVATRRLALLNRAAGAVVWLGVALVLFAAIVRIFLTVYVNNIEQNVT